MFPCELRKRSAPSDFLKHTILFVITLFRTTTGDLLNAEVIYDYFPDEDRRPKPYQQRVEDVYAQIRKDQKQRRTAKAHPRYG